MWRGKVRGGGAGGAGRGEVPGRTGATSAGAANATIEAVALADAHRPVVLALRPKELRCATTLRGRVREANNRRTGEGKRGRNIDTKMDG